MEPCLEVKILSYHLLHYTENDNSEFFQANQPGDFRSWESPQTLPALFIGPFEGVERFRNLKFAVIRITDIQKTVLSFFEGTTAIHFAFKQRLINNKPSYYYSNGPAKIYTEVDCDWWRRTFGDSQESPGSFF